VGLTTTDPCMANFCSNTAYWFPNIKYGSSTPPAFVDVESYGKVLGTNSHSASNGAQIPLTQVADIRYVMGPAMISSENALLRAYVLMNVRGRDPMSFVEEASKVVAQKVMLPHGYFIQWSGQFENQVRVRVRLQILVPLSMFLGFILVFMAFKSFPQTMFILFAGIPTAIAGGVWL